MKHELIKYRPEIDGLRAIAILSVILFHTFPEKIPGGFIGVDIFFVISGYLISSIIISGLHGGIFSIKDFYSRRIKRIFPALLIVLLSCLVFGWFSLLSEEYLQLGHHIFGASTFTNNFILWKESGYFDNASETKPLLHLWSLSIEEQFYLVWPWVLWVSYKKNWNLLYITSALCFLSFLFHILNLAHSGTVSYAFYAPHLRAWELLVGSVTYQISNQQRNTKIWGGNLQSALGLLLILIGLFFINKYNKFPGWYALFFPILGTVLIIRSNSKNWVSKYMLSNRFITSIGLISYSLYLWHWPILSFARIIENQDPSIFLKISALILAISLSIITYQYIEKPLRKNSKVIFLIMPMIFFGIAGYAIKEKNGIAERKYAHLNIVNIEDKIDIHTIYKDYYPCEKFNKAYPEKSSECFQSKKEGAIDIAILGDSHAEHLFPGIAETLKDKNVAVFFKKTGMPFETDQDFNAFYTYINSDQDIKKLFFIFYWKSKLLDVKRKKQGGSINFSQEFTKPINHIFNRKINIYLLDDIPNFSFDPKQCKYHNPLSTIKNNCKEDSSNFYRDYINYMATLNQITFRNNPIPILNTSKFLCGNQNCFMAQNNELFYQDNNHLNLNGSKYIAKKLIMNNNWIAD